MLRWTRFAAHPLRLSRRSMSDKAVPWKIWMRGSIRMFSGLTHVWTGHRQPVGSNGPKGVAVRGSRRVSLGLEESHRQPKNLHALFQSRNRHVTPAYDEMCLFRVWCLQKAKEIHLQPPSDGLQPNSDGLQPNSDGLQPNSDGLQHNSDGLQHNSDGLQPTSHGLQPNSNGLQPNSDGIQPIAMASNLRAMASNL